MRGDEEAVHESGANLCASEVATRRRGEVPLVPQRLSRNARRGLLFFVSCALAVAVVWYAGENGVAWKQGGTGDLSKLYAWTNTPDHSRGHWISGQDADDPR